MVLLLIFLLTFSLARNTPSSDANPYQPFNLTWVIIKTGTGEIVNSSSVLTSKGQGWPTLQFDLCRLATGSWDLGDWTLESKGRPECGNTGEGCTLPPVKGRGPGCGHILHRADLQGTDFYVCPGGGRTISQTRKCGGEEHFYCRDWGCESTGSIGWNPPVTDDLISVKKIKTPRKSINPLYGDCSNFLCNPVSVQFTELGKKFDKWEAGRTWGVRLYQSGYDQGLLFTIKLSASPIYSEPVGPNAVLAPKRPQLSPVAHTPKTPAASE